MRNKQYNSKILFFGEYSVLLGSDALAVPYNQFKGELTFTANRDQEEYKLSNDELAGFVEYLKTKNLDLFNRIKTAKFEQDLKRGLYFLSNIPQNYGLGSSGAITAAVYDLYSDFTSTEKYNSVKHAHHDLKIMESFFHSSSSGIDPLCSLISKPVLIKVKEPSLVQIINDKTLSVFLLDTEKPRLTGRLVQQFKQQWEKQEFIFQMMHEYIPLNNRCINSFLKKRNTLDDELFELSYYQFKNFSRLIIEIVINHWEYGLKKELFFLKLCGAGGGGYLLGFTRSIDKVYRYFEKAGLKIKIVQ